VGGVVKEVDDALDTIRFVLSVITPNVPLDELISEQINHPCALSR